MRNDLLAKRLLALTLILALVLVFGSCNKPEPQEINPEPPATADPGPNTPEVTATPAPTPTPTPEPTPTPTPTPTPEPTPTPYNGPTDPLTGLPVSEDISGKRPISVMINNLKAALPQCGVSGAAIIYETLAEGGITRMLAVFSDVSDIGPIGSVRSSRDYFIDLAQGLDAIYIHAGGSPQAYSALSSRRVTNIDGLSGSYALFYRDQERLKTYSYEHCLFTSGELLGKLSDYDLRLEHDEDYVCPLEFTDDGTPEGGASASKISVKFSEYKTGIFEYDESSGLYMVSQYGSPYTDGNNGLQVGVTNVVVLKTDMWSIRGDDAGRIGVQMTGEGSGWFACGGKYVPIKWSKASPSDPFIYILEDGDALVFGRGTTYVNIIPQEQNPVFE